MLMTVKLYYGRHYGYCTRSVAPCWQLLPQSERADHSATGGEAKPTELAAL